jgi:hypothetical protein
MRARCFVFALLLFVPVLAQAQTQAIGTESLQWDQAAQTLAQATGYAYDVKDGTAAAVAIAGVTCSGAASPFVCGTRLPALTTWLHSLAVIAKTTVNGQVLASAPSAPLSLLMVAVPAIPQNVRIGP